MAEELKQRKLDMINAIHSNPNMDQESVNKSDAVRQVEEQFDEAIESIYEDRVEKIDKKNPFFAAIDRGLEWIDNPTAQKKLDAARAQGEGDPEEPHSSEFEIDQ